MMAPVRRRAGENRVLDSLTAPEAAFILPHLELVPLDPRAMLFQEGALATHVYFPVSGLISLVTRVGAVGVESATIGSEGMVGLHIFLKATESAYQSVVQMRGEAWRFPAPAFVDELDRCPAWSNSIKRYTAARLWMSSRTAACTQLHSIAQRTARWLLFANDHAQQDDFSLTHGLLAKILGVRRASVTNALGALQRQSIIGTSRGKIKVLDRQRLEAAACECHGAIRGYNSLSLA